MSIFNLKNTIGREFDMPVDDQALTKKALLHLGYEDATPDLVTPYVGNQSFDGLMGFQKDQGLKIDGIARPGRSDGARPRPGTDPHRRRCRGHRSGNAVFRKTPDRAGRRSHGPACTAPGGSVCPTHAAYGDAASLPR